MLKAVIVDSRKVLCMCTVGLHAGSSYKVGLSLIEVRSVLAVWSAICHKADQAASTLLSLCDAPEMAAYGQKFRTQKSMSAGSSSMSPNYWGIRGLKTRYRDCNL